MGTNSQIAAGPLLLADQLGEPPSEWKVAPRMKAGHVEMDGFEEAQQRPASAAALRRGQKKLG